MTLSAQADILLDMTTILGLTCISEELKEKDKKKYSFRTMTRKRFNDLCNSEGRDEAIFQLSERILHNVGVTQYIINHCHTSNIRHYRLSSALFPLLTDPTLEISMEELPHKARIEEELRLAGLIALTFKISIGSHPDQFNVLASTNERSVNQTIKELNFQASILDKLGLPQDHSAPMNIHINATPPEIKSDIDPDSINNARIKEVAERFYNNLMRCNEGVFNRLTIENEDKGFWNVDNILKFSKYIFKKYRLNIPVCYDNLHDICNPSEVNNVRWQTERCAYTWAEECSPVFHWSEGRADKPRAHADYFSYKFSPPTFCVREDQPIKWECEVKHKDKAIRLLRDNLSQKNY